MRERGVRGPTSVGAAGGPAGRRTRNAFAAASLAVCLSVAGCFTAGTAGLVLVAGSGGGGGGGGTSVVLPVVTVQDPPTEAGGDVRISYTLVEEKSQPLTISVQVELPGKAPFTVTEATGKGSEGTLSLAASPQGTSHLFVWNSFADTGPTGGQTATLTIAVTNPATQAAGNAVSVTVISRNDYIQSVLSPALGRPDRFAINPEVALVPGPRGGAPTRLLIADPQQHRVWEMSLQDGSLTSIAGIGIPGFSDDVPATSASLNTPTGLVADADGNIFIADAGNARVRRIDAVTGFISTVAGGGSDVLGQGDGGAATLAHLTRPERIALDADQNLYISDAGAGRVRVVNRTAQEILVANKMIEPATIETVLNLPAVVVAVATAFGGGGSTGAEGGTFLQATLAGITVWGTPTGTTTSPVEIYVAEARLPAIIRITSATSTPEIVFREGQGGDELSALAGLTVSDVGGPLALYAADPTGSVVAKLPLDILPPTPLGHHGVSDPQIIAGQRGNVGFKGDGGQADNAELNRPQGVAVGSAGASAALFIADTGNQVVRAVNLGDTGTPAITIAGKRIEPGTIQSITSGGDNGPANPSVLAAPTGGALLSDGTAVIADFFGGTVMRIDPVTREATTIATGLKSPGGLAVIPVATGTPTHVAVSEVDGHRVLKVPLAITGTPITRVELLAQGLVLAGSGTSTGSVDGDVVNGGDDNLEDGHSATDKATLHSPFGLSIQNLGQAGFRLFIADAGNHRIRVVDENGIIHTYVNDQTVIDGDDVFPAGGYGGDGLRTDTLLTTPFGVSVDAANGLLWISDTGNHLVRKVRLESPTTTLATASVTTTVGLFTSATTTQSGYNGDNRPALGATLNEPIDLVRVSDRLFIADQKNQRIRVVELGANPPLIFTSAGTGGQGFNGDGIPPENAALSDPAAVFYGVIDGKGALYIGDTGNVRLRRYAP